eukprot:jgi/Chlat1/7889/Chrsp66S09179
MLAQPEVVGAPMSAQAQAQPTPASTTSPSSSSSPSVVIYTTQACNFCKKSKALLKEKGIEYQEVDVVSDRTLLERLQKVTGRKTVPQIYIQGKHLGGWDDLSKAVEENRLQDLLQAQPSHLPAELTAPTKPPTPSGSSDSRAKAQNEFETFQYLEGLALKLAASLPGDRSGADIVDWLLSNAQGIAGDRARAVELGRELQQAHLLHHTEFCEVFVDEKGVLFHAHESEPGPRSKNALNSTITWVGPSRPASEVAEDLRKRVLALYDLALSKDGKRLNYKSLQNSPEFQDYVRATAELQRVDLFALDRKQKMAFFINLYNALVIHATVIKGTPSNPLQRIQFFKSFCYNVGGDEYTLDDMENGVLRGNRFPASSIIFKKRPFSSSDPRRFHAIVPVDPRIHFALVCGAKSCPPIRIYTPENLDTALEGAAEAFCEGDVSVDRDTGVVTLSKIFDWYKVDFGADMKERLQWLLVHLDWNKRKVLESLLVSGNYKVEYSKYNWDLND